MSQFGAWHYAIYLLPGGAGLLLLLLCVLGGGRHHGNAGGGHHALGHHTPGHGGPAAHPHSVLPHTAHAAARPPAPLAFFGAGRVPFPLLWGSGLLGWGLFGFWTTRLFPLSAALWEAVIVAILGSVAAARTAAYLWMRLLPAEETYVTETVELCGLTGTAVYPVDTARGRVHVYDTYGTLHDVSARTAAGQPAIPRGRTTLVTDYDATRGVLIVEEL